jgi:hypothetical protein
MEIEALTVEIAGGFAVFEEFLDLRVVEVVLDGGGAAAERALAVRQRQRLQLA